MLLFILTENFMFACPCLIVLSSYVTSHSTASFEIYNFDAVGLYQSFEIRFVNSMRSIICAGSQLQGQRPNKIEKTQ